MSKLIDTLYIYTRVSYSKKSKGHSLAAQRNKGIQKAKALGFDYIVVSES